MAFTRNPATGLPATYEGTNNPDQLILLDQASDITISGLDADDNIVIGTYGGGLQTVPATGGEPEALTQLDVVVEEARIVALAEAFWPGPLTLIAPVRQAVRLAACPGGTVAIRVPSCPPARLLAQAFGAADGTRQHGREQLGPLPRGHRAPRAQQRDADLLLDAPCAGLGTIRRRPEIKLRLDEEAPQRMARLQRRLVEGVRRLLRPAGRLVYSVCTVFPEETVEIAEFAGDTVITFDVPDLNSPTTGVLPGSKRLLSEQEAAAERLNRTEFAQPALFAIEHALAALWASWGIRPDIEIGRAHV